MGEWIQIEKDRLGRAKRHVRKPKRTTRGPRRPEPANPSGDRAIEVDDVPEFRASRFLILGDPRRLVQRINAHLVVARFARGHLGLVGHYRLAHVEAGPFATLGEARAAWVRMRAELDAFRTGRLAARAGTGPEPVANGAGWTAQRAYAGHCPGCRDRVRRRGDALPPLRRRVVPRGTPDPAPVAPGRGAG